MWKRISVCMMLDKIWFSLSRTPIPFIHTRSILFCSHRTPARERATIIGYLREFYPSDHRREIEVHRQKNQASRRLISAHPFSLVHSLDRVCLFARERACMFSSPPRHIIPATRRDATRRCAPPCHAIPWIVRSIPRPPAIRRPSFDDPEFVITSSREPRNRNFAGYDVRYRELG